MSKPLQARANEQVVVAARAGIYHFRRGSDVVAISLEAGQETLLHADLAATSPYVRASYEMWGTLPSRQWLVR